MPKPAAAAAAGRGGMGGAGGGGDALGEVLAAASADPFAFAARPPAKKPRAAPAAKPVKRKPAARESESDASPSGSDDEYGEPVRKPAVKKAAAAKPRAKPAAASKPAPAVAALKPKPPAKRAKHVSSDDDDHDDDGADENAPLPLAAASRRPARQAAVSGRGKWVERAASESDSEDEASESEDEASGDDGYAE